MSREISLFKYIALIFIFNFCYTSVFAYETCKTSTGTDIKWNTSNITYYVNSSGGPSNSLSAIQSSMQTWTDVNTSSFNFIYGGSTSSTAHGTYDGVNIVTFGSMGSTGTLAVNAYWYYVSTGQMIDSDIKFNTNYSWATSGSSSAYDVQNVGTHEFGHSLCLKDLYNSADSEKTMYGYASSGETKKRDLHSDDIAGVTFLYPNGGGGGGSISHTQIPPSNTSVVRGGTLGPFYGSITNSYSSSQTVYVTPYLYTPAGEWVNIFIRPTTISAGGTHSSGAAYITISSNATTGTYYHVVIIYDTNWNQLDVDSFSFTVTSASQSPQSSDDSLMLKQLMETPGAKVFENEGWKMIIVPEK
ncbi:MAG: matrixin family metalloprotease [Nitrospirota bacterium]